MQKGGVVNFFELHLAYYSSFGNLQSRAMFPFVNTLGFFCCCFFPHRLHYVIINICFISLLQMIVISNGLVMITKQTKHEKCDVSQLPVSWLSAVSLLSSTLFSEIRSITTELGPLTKHIAISSRCVVMCAVDYIFNPQCVPEGWSPNPTLDLH